ncbi:general stress protein [Metabacillus fastidiosus]|uniref:General stress protein n=1 Tax=Metabacillus fastidiosus TaxID=1458 RepID=A0ABU6NXI6_9BACI|nr:general stress protein [Metabacillus fastidiosus]MEC2078037.1 general stress protein [Metabacillus fastidiosus]MED4400571.1 general stress protein [Metabacillus fastidiosus]MED4464534.1 general stress protein [Metabacillus fastidiosus]
MDRQKKRVIGVYDTEAEAIIAIDGLIKQGYESKEICVIGKDLKHVNKETDTTTEDPATTGAFTGGTIGGVTGILAGVGALTIPGIGPIIAAGPIASGLIGALAGAGIGGLCGALVDSGISEDDAERYGNSVKEGKILILVNSKDDHLNRDIRVLEEEIPTEADMTAVNGNENNTPHYNTYKDRNPYMPSND